MTMSHCQPLAQVHTLHAHAGHRQHRQHSTIAAAHKVKKDNQRTQYKDTSGIKDSHISSDQASFTVRGAGLDVLRVLMVRAILTGSARAHQPF